MAHTSGPWQIRERYLVTNSADRVVADCGFGSLPDDECEANARLIAAAPDLRAALAALVQTFHARPDILSLCGPHEHAQIKAACDALNKAEPGR